MHIAIHASGPGGTLGAPLWKVRQVLEELGFTVQDNDPHAMTDAEAQMVLDRANYKGSFCTITANHIPWGG
jgi:hypothetical protein